MNLARFSWAAACLALLLLSAPAAEARSVAEALRLPLQRARLENGLRVVMNPDRTSPNVAICVTYDVGSRNETPGRRGFAHLFEHMMFQGSRNVAKGDHFKWISARGGTLNGTTSADRTNYFEVLPPGELALGLWLEADRMKSLAVTRENLENQRAVVQEEYRMRVSNQAYATGHMRLGSLVYEGYPPYAHDPIGVMEELDAAKFEWVKEFHQSYYAPNNAVLSIVGDFDPDQAMSLVRLYFGDAQAQPNVPEYSPPEPEHAEAPRAADVEDVNAQTPGLYLGWMIPPARDEEHYALELAALLLGDGESSRLHQRLVRGDAVARSAHAWTRDRRGPDMLALQILLTERSDLEAVERTVLREVEGLGQRGPSSDELAKAKRRVAAYFVKGLQSNMHRAAELANFELFYGDARLLTRELERYQAVTEDEVRQAVRKYLASQRRSTVRVLPVAFAAGESR
jgi:zinc protease